MVHISQQGSHHVSPIDLGPLAFVWRGAWNSATQDYTLNNVVRHHGTLYIGVQDTILAGTFPGISPAWDVFLQPSAPAYTLCEFYFFRHPVLPRGFMPAYGEIVENAAMLYPEAWAYLRTDHGRMLCLTEDEWQAMSTATWHTLADGTEIGWEGVGGVPFYVLDMEAQTLRLPDLRGMYAEAAGFDSLGVGGVHGDGIREITGTFSSEGNHAFYRSATGAFILSGGTGVAANGATSNYYKGATLMASNVVPTSNKNQPRAWGALPCVYLGA